MARKFSIADGQVELFNLSAETACKEYQSLQCPCFSSDGSFRIFITLISSEVTKQTYKDLEKWIEEKIKELFSHHFEEVIRQARWEGFKEGFSEGVTSPYNKQWYDWDD